MNATAEGRENFLFSPLFSYTFPVRLAYLPELTGILTASLFNKHLVGIPLPMLL
jgi:hypothetical protein